MAHQRASKGRELKWARRAKKDIEPVLQLIDRTSATIKTAAEALRALLMLVGLASIIHMVGSPA
jgi:hypothetical protein